jgi:hypothetical protein
MKKAISNIFFIVIFGQLGFTQTDSIKIEYITKTKINYQSFVLLDSRLFALNDSGQVIIWDLEKLDTIHFAFNNPLTRYTAITKDRNNQIVLGTNTGVIFNLDPKKMVISKDFQIKYSIASICFNSNNKMFLIIPSAVYDPMSKKRWDEFENHASGIIVRKKVLGFFWERTDKYFSMPDFTYLDSKDRWWMCKSYGEFGGEAQVFDTKNIKVYDNKFEGINTGLFFPKSVFEDLDGNIYITSGLQHFGSSGEIYKINTNRVVEKIYDTEDYRDTTDHRIFGGGIFVGPGAYNIKENSIYFATDQGFYKVRLPKYGKLERPILLFNPTLTWGREPLAIGIDMTIKNLEFTKDNNLMFLTSNDGFGLYDGSKLKIFK